MSSSEFIRAFKTNMKCEFSETRIEQHENLKFYLKVDVSFGDTVNLFLNHLLSSMHFNIRLFAYSLTVKSLLK